MKVNTIATVSADGSTDVAVDNQSAYKRHPEGILQVAITGTMTIQVLGSLDGTNYSEMIAASASGSITAIALVPFLRITASSTSGGTATILLGTSGPY